MEKGSILSIKNFPHLLPPGENINKMKEDEERAKRVCREFESLFWQEIFKMMRKMTWGKGWGNNYGAENEIYHTLLEQEVSRILAQKKGLGIGELIYKQISREHKK